MLVILFSSGVAALGIDFREVVSDLLPALNARTASTLNWWTEAELYEWADEAAKRLARGFRVFVKRDASQSIALADPAYDTPARHVSTIHVSIGTRALEAASVHELEAADAAWLDTAGVTGRFLLDANGQSEIRVYPTPDATVTGALAVIYHQYPAAVTATDYDLTAPHAIREYFTWSILSEARAKQGDARMPDVAAHFAGRVALMEQVIEAYWGTG